MPAYLFLSSVKYKIWGAGWRIQLCLKLYIKLLCPCFPWFKNYFSYKKIKYYFSDPWKIILANPEDKLWSHQEYHVKYLTFIYNCLHSNQIYHITLVFILKFNYFYLYNQMNHFKMMHVIMKKTVKSMMTVMWALIDMILVMLHSYITKHLVIGYKKYAYIRLIFFLLFKSVCHF